MPITSEMKPVVSEKQTIVERKTPIPTVNVEPKVVAKQTIVAATLPSSLERFYGGSAKRSP